MRAHSHSGTLGRIWITGCFFALSLTFGCSKSKPTTVGEAQPTALVAATISPTAPAPVATSVAVPSRATPAERLVEIDLLLAKPLTGTPEQADERSLLRAERAALISSGQVPFQSGDPPAGQLARSSQPAIAERSPAAYPNEHGPVMPDAHNDQIVIATNSQASNLPFLEQMSPSELDRYFQWLWLQNGSFVDVNVNHGGFGFGRFGVNRRRPHMRPPGRTAMANQPLYRGR
jgi:hypothetical protein